jgi:hypothetical protein
METGNLGERLTALFLLGAVLFNPLVVRIFDVGSSLTLGGVPLLYAYVFVAWGVLIALLAVTVERNGIAGEERPEVEPSDDDLP